MAYGFKRELFVEHGPTVLAADALRLSSSKGFRAWRSLTPDSRLSIVDASLRRAPNEVVSPTAL